jgi:hypothetical protein
MNTLFFVNRVFFCKRSNPEFIIYFLMNCFIKKIPTYPAGGRCVRTFQKALTHLIVTVLYVTATL